MKNKIKVYHCIHNLEIGGAERLLTTLLRYGNQSQFSFKVITIASGGYFQKQIEDLGISVINLNRVSKLGLLTLWRLVKIFWQEKPQIVHTHLFAGDTFGRLAAWLARVPIIISTEHAINLDEGRIKKLLKRILSRVTDVQIFISQATRDYALKIEKIKAKMIQVIPNFIDLQNLSFKPRRMKTFNQSFVIGSLGRLVKMKNFDLLIIAFQDLLKLGYSCQLFLAGEGPERLRLEELVKSLGITEKVRFLGAITKLQEFFDQLDIYVQASETEGFGLAVVEAMACGLPVIASQGGALKEIVQEQKTGLTFQVNNQNELSQKLIWAIKNYQAMLSLAEKANNHVRQNFSAIKVTQEYYYLYENLINQ